MLFDISLRIICLFLWQFFFVFVSFRTNMLVFKEFSLNSTVDYDDEGVVWWMNEWMDKWWTQTKQIFFFYLYLKIVRNYGSKMSINFFFSMLVDDDNKRIIIWMMGIHLPESIIENSFVDDDVNRWIKIVTHTHTPTFNMMNSHTHIHKKKHTTKFTRLSSSFQQQQQNRIYEKKIGQNCIPTVLIPLSRIIR